MRPIYILDRPNRAIKRAFIHAFKTKVGKEKKNYTPIAITTLQAAFMEHKLFPLNTRRMDLVLFDNGVWF